MFAFKISLMLSAAVAGAYVMPLGTSQMLVIAQAIFGICVSFALFIVVLHAAEHNSQDLRDGPRETSARGRGRRHWRHAGRHSRLGRIE